MQLIDSWFSEPRADGRADWPRAGVHALVLGGALLSIRKLLRIHSNPTPASWKIVPGQREERGEPVQAAGRWRRPTWKAAAATRRGRRTSPFSETCPTSATARRSRSSAKTVEQTGAGAAPSCLAMVRKMNSAYAVEPRARNAVEGAKQRRGPVPFSSWPGWEGGDFEGDLRLPAAAAAPPSFHAEHLGVSLRALFSRTGARAGREGRQRETIRTRREGHIYGTLQMTVLIDRNGLVVGCDHRTFVRPLRFLDRAGAPNCLSLPAPLSAVSRPERSRADTDVLEINTGPGCLPMISSEPRPVGDTVSGSR